MLTPERLREMLNYDPLSGEFTWKVRASAHVYPGNKAGSNHSKGYRHICISKRLYLSHVLAVAHVYGAFHTGEIDHINGNKSDNRIANLRCVDKSINLQNQKKAHSNNKSGFLGVSKTWNRWKAVIKVNKVRIYIGTYPTAEDAHIAYLAVKRQLHVGCTI